MPQIIVFDVNETLLDLSALDPLFEKHFGNAEVRRAWFGQVLLTSMTVTLTDDYADFAKVGGAALGMVAERLGISLNEAQIGEILAGMRTLPAHSEVAEALDMLGAAGYRMVTLTNSPPTMVEKQIDNAGLAGSFERLLSVDAVKKFKPARAVYDMAAQELGEAPQDLWLVAAHNWDTSGALAAGWKAGFVARPGMVTGALDREPTVRGQNLTEVAAKIIATDGQ
ncbi:MAG: haloacid dehalogenase type II [Alphaproteobacteria bacterium]